MASVPLGAIGPTTTRVLLALLAAGERPTMAELGQILGIGRPAVHHHLHVLRDHGLVAFEDRKARTLRATVARVPIARVPVAS